MTNLKHITVEALGTGTAALGVGLLLLGISPDKGWLELSAAIVTFIGLASALIGIAGIFAVGVVSLVRE